MQKKHIKYEQKIKSGFTLAEVLITLGVIGVLAALTIPTLIQNTQEKATVTALKKTYSTLSQAYTMAVNDNGTPDEWGMGTAGWAAPEMLDKLKPYLRINKDCIDGSKGCFPPEVNYKYLATSLGTQGVWDDGGRPKLKLADGTLISSASDTPSCNNIYGSSFALQNECGWYMVDINGWKQPNQVGRDVFFFWLTKYGIVPAGSVQDNPWAFSGSSGCKDKDNDYGYGCAAWVIYNENMDYLHCSDLAWNGKHKCG